MPATDLVNGPVSALDPAIAARLRRTPDGLVAAIVQEAGTGDVLMLAWMDDEALHRTLTTDRTYWWWPEVAPLTQYSWRLREK